jgi:ribosomal protein L37AE/L43A
MGLSTQTCDSCGLFSNVLHRANEKGVAGIWWCEHCMALEGKLVDPEVKEITDIIDGRPTTRDNR